MVIVTVGPTGPRSPRAPCTPGLPWNYKRHAIDVRMQMHHR